MPIVYRIENETNDGPYITDYLADKYGWEIHTDEEHPIDYVDMSEDVECMDRWKCACESIELLNQWFEGYMEELLENGFYLMRIEVKKYAPSISGRQCFFQEENVINRYCIQAEIELV